MSKRVLSKPKTKLKPKSGRKKTMSYDPAAKPSETKSSAVEKPVKNAEKPSGGGGGEYAELTGLIIGKAEDSFDGPVTVTIQLMGTTTTNDLVLSYPNSEAATKIPSLLDDKGQHLPPIPVVIKVLPGEGAPPPGTAKPKDKAQDKDNEKAKDKEKTQEGTPPPATGSVY